MLLKVSRFPQQSTFYYRSGYRWSPQTLCDREGCLLRHLSVMLTSTVYPLRGVRYVTMPTQIRFVKHCLVNTRLVQPSFWQIFPVFPPLWSTVKVTHVYWSTCRLGETPTAAWLQWKPACKNTHFRGSGWLGSYISGILGEISLKVFLSVLKFYF